MANIYTTQITFYTETSNSDELEKLFKIITRTTNDASYDEKAISKELGFELRDNLTLGDSIELLYNEIQTHSGGDFIYFQLIRDSRWSPRMEIFDEILKNFKNIEYVFTAEEPGNDIYINTDIERLFYDTEYKMEIPILDKSFSDFLNSTLKLLGLNSESLKDYEYYSEYYCDEKSLLEHGNELFSREFESFHELKDYAESLSKLTDVYIGVFEYDWNL